MLLLASASLTLPFTPPESDHELVSPEIVPCVDVIPSQALFTSTQKPKFFQDSLSHRIFRRMHGVLNINENSLVEIDKTNLLSLVSP